ncbi:hypothetical protein MN116_001440 [Schistosoma mekongi]|uniref:Uncharacterized protein n=1 Tax=Schistosoma mekongi TaxID=38744 RepID=A0AAE2D9M7_SCHME|nr:hypothetical protein MN116_001440 [Schistosoma mekongi]
MSIFLSGVTYLFLPVIELKLDVSTIHYICIHIYHEELMLCWLTFASDYYYNSMKILRLKKGSINFKSKGFFIVFTGSIITVLTYLLSVTFLSKYIKYTLNHQKVQKVSLFNF